MSESIFEEGGPHKIKRIDTDKYQMNVSLPLDSDGRLARECPSENCSPGYFKVKPGTGITSEQKSAFCPYCRFSSEPKNFATKEQVRYVKDSVMREAHEGIGKMIQDALGLGPSGKKKYGDGLISMEMSYKSGTLPHVRPPIESELKRDVICPNCGLDHSVYGLATWCADCGKDIFLTHVEAELNVVKTMLEDVSRRQEKLGPRVAAKDIENCLEDTVSIFEAVLKVLLIRYYTNKGLSENEINDILKKKVGNVFQSITRTDSFFQAELGFKVFDGLNKETLAFLELTFEMRHPITHNLGIVDRKYLEKVRSAEKEGREIRVTIDDIKKAINISFDIFKSTHRRLFRADDGNSII
jgi:hypothetical protein